MKNDTQCSQEAYGKHTDAMYRDREVEAMEDEISEETHIEAAELNRRYLGSEFLKLNPLTFQPKTERGA